MTQAINDERWYHAPEYPDDVSDDWTDLLPVVMPRGRVIEINECAVVRNLWVTPVWEEGVWTNKAFDTQAEAQAAAVAIYPCDEKEA